MKPQAGIMNIGNLLIFQLLSPPGIVRHDGEKRILLNVETMCGIASIDTLNQTNHHTLLIFT
jgi:hypothetical protein